MLRFGVLAVFASACGRLGFDAPTSDGSTTTGDGSSIDGLLGHDEDGDGIPDTLDFCPHVADTANLDGDNDLVGDACDWEPGAANQQWVIFSPMGTLPSFAVGPNGAWTMNGDDWHYTDAASQCQLLRSGIVTNLDVWVGFDVEVLGTGGIQAALVINGGGVPYWYAELFDGGNDVKLSITEYDGANYIARSTKVVGAAFPLGATDLHLAARDGASFTAYSRSDMVTFATPGYTGGDVLNIGFGNHSGRVRYVAIVRSQ